MSPDFEFLKVNRAGYESIGKKPDELIGKKCYEVIHELDGPIDSCPCARMIRTRKASSGEVTMYGRHYVVTVSPMLDENNELIAFVHTFKDITERKKIEKQIRRADKLATLGQLAAGLAHEIRNPLAGISGAVQILRDDIPEDESSREILDEIVQKIDTLGSSIKNFLRFARPAPLQFSPTDINEVVQSVLFLISKQARTQRVSIVEECDNGLPIIRADSEQLQQVILNIALNSLQAIGEGGGEISFKTYQSSVTDQIVIEISDNGEGIPAENLDHIFDPYFTTKSEGTGLGLSITQRVVEEHGGTISVESEVGKGTTFKVGLGNGQSEYLDSR